MSYQKPHNPLPTATIGRWLKEVLKRAGVDIQKFSAHSTRSASVSAAKSLNISVKTILDAAGWSNAATFATFYDWPVISNDCSDNYRYCLLKALDPHLSYIGGFRPLLCSHFMLVAMCFNPFQSKRFPIDE